VNKLIEAFAYNTSPIGPLGDHNARKLEEEQWLNSLTSDDGLVLLAWIQQPTPLPGWNSLTEGQIAELCDIAAYYVGTVGQRTGDDRLRFALEGLLTDSRTRVSALEGLRALGNPVVVSAISAYVDNADPQLARQIASVLGEIGGNEAITVLHGMYDRWKDDLVVQGTIEDALQEAKRG